MELGANLNVVRHFQQNVALGVRVFHGKSTVLWIGQVHVLDGNLEIIPVLYKNHFLFKQMEIQAKLLKTTTATGRRDVEAIEKIPNQQAKTIR